MNLRNTFVFFMTVTFFSCLKKECPAPLNNNSLVIGLGSNSLKDNTSNLLGGIDDTKDAFLASYYPNVNYGLDFKNYCSAWTVGGVPTKGLFLLKFNYDLIPKGVNIISAKLTLIADTSNVFIGSPSPMKAHYGSNLNFSIRRVEAYWDESTVTFASKPLSSNIHKITLDSPPTLTSSYIDIDVSELVKDQIATNNYGFEVSLESDTPYSRLAFYSSNSPYISFRPRLIISYK